MLTHIKDEKPVARKEHRCELCGLSIPKGIKHVKRTLVESYDGFHSFRMHEQCELITRDWDVNDWEYSGLDAWSFRNEELPPETLAKIQALKPNT